MEFSVQNICGFLIRSRLLSADEVKGMYQHWQKEAKVPENSSEFAQWLVANHYVTEYQASLVTRGLPDNFFLNQYKILDRIGQGAMAGVFKAVHSLGQVVAIKVLPPSRAKMPKLLERFKREAELAMRLKHPNVVRAFQIGEIGGLYYFVMEYLEGETLEEVLRRRGPLPPEEGVRIVYQALMGLQHIHEKGMIHRDLKPSNLMLVSSPTPGQPDTTLNATVKILDIGLAKPLFEENGDNSSKRNLTGFGVLLGTPDYLAPEQARDAAAADIRADIYSLGCVLYTILAGCPPFPDSNVITQMVRHQTETARPLKYFNPAIPDGLQQILDWMMAKEPNKRYPTPERAAQALQVFIAAGTGPPSGAEGDPKTKLFLSWIEESGKTKADEKPGPVSPAAPAVTSGPPQVPAQESPSPRPRDGPPSGRRLKGAPGKKKGLTPVKNSPRVLPQRPGSTAQDQATTRAEAAVDQFDVEILPLSPEQPAILTLGKQLRLTRRDLAFLGAGAGTMALGLGILYGLIKLAVWVFG